MTSAGGFARRASPRFTYPSTSFTMRFITFWRKVQGNSTITAVRTVAPWDQLRHISLTSFCRHEIGGGHRSKNDNISIDALVSHDSYCATRINRSIRLRDLIVETGFTDFGDVDVVSLSGNSNSFRSYFSENPDGDSSYLMVSCWYVGAECTSYGRGTDAVGSVSVGKTGLFG